MKDINQVQKALEGKAKRELARVVDNFVISLNELNNKYHQPCFYYMVEHGGSDAQRFNCMGQHRVESVLNSMLQKAYLEAMVSKKTKELLAKLELL
jgi:hypothetical protein